MITLPRSILLSALTTLSVCALSSCSLVYSPFMHLPATPLYASDLEVSGSGAAMPETSPGFMLASGAGEGLIRFGVSDRFTLQARAWSRVSDIRSYRLDGTSLDGIITLNQRRSQKQSLGKKGDLYSGFDFALVPRVMSLFGSGELGVAGSLSFAVWLPETWVLRPYIATGGIFGGGVASGGGTGYGYGMINNAGVTTTFDPHLSFNAEIANPIVYINNSNETLHRTSFLLVPSLSMSYKF